MTKLSLRPGKTPVRHSILRRLPTVWLSIPNSKQVKCEQIRRVFSLDAPLLSTVDASADAALLPVPEVRGKVFRVAGVIISAPPEIDFPLQGELFAVLGGANKYDRGKRRSVEFLYDFLYPTVEEDSTNIPGFVDLHAYQRAGVQFLVSRSSALLADDMGLGKTAQCSIAIAILKKQERLRRALVICPRSVIQQWKAEAKRWGGLWAKIVDGDPAARKLIWRHQPGLLLATPQIVLNDAKVLADEQFDLVVCDDVPTLKNAGKITNAIRDLGRDRSWCLNGTPLENRPEDLLNTMEFVCPGIFTFAERKDAPSKLTIDRRIEPYFLRRRKQDHLLDLPDKVPVGPIPVDLGGAQLSAYREVEQARWAGLLPQGDQVSRPHIFAIISELIRLCNYHAPSRQSAKLERLAEELDTVLADPDNRAVVFAHDVQCLHFLAENLAQHTPIIYHGGLTQQQRNRALSDFKSSKRLLLGSVKACGRGLNFQQASYVFHFDRTWNPIDELQAEDRCWRQGQMKTVFVTRYLVRGTIEERIDRVLARKKDLFDAYIDSKSVGADNSDEVASSKWTLEEFLEILRPDESRHNRSAYQGKT